MDREEFEQYLRNDPHGAAMSIFDRLEAVELTVADFTDVVAGETEAEQATE